RTPDRRRREVLVDPRLKSDVMVFERPPRLRQRLVVAAQGRAPIARNEARRVEPRRPVAALLDDRQANQRLGPRHIYRTLGQQIFVVERNLGQTHGLRLPACGKYVSNAELLSQTPWEMSLRL